MTVMILSGIWKLFEIDHSNKSRVPILVAELPFPVITSAKLRAVENNRGLCALLCWVILVMKRWDNVGAQIRGGGSLNLVAETSFALVMDGQQRLNRLGTTQCQDCSDVQSTGS